MSSDSMRFGFGKNWDQYVRQHFSEERLEFSRRQLLEFLHLENLKGKTFLDIGCGSGLHSLAALRAGAEKVISFDLDSDSVTTTCHLKNWAADPPHWQVMQGSILDESFINGLEPADIVYSWGVLHHTGNMWKAMDHFIRLIKPGGLAFIALYDYDIQTNPTAEYWLDIKQKYNRCSRWGKRKMELWYIWRFILYGNIFRLPELVKRSLGYKQFRGMALYTDIVDWLGGWPMEFAKRADVKQWAEKAGLEMLTMKTGEANTEYLFKMPLPG